MIYQTIARDDVSIQSNGLLGKLFRVLFYVKYMQTKMKKKTKAASSDFDEVSQLCYPRRKKISTICIPGQIVIL